MIKIAILDDEEEIRYKIGEYVRQFFGEKKGEVKLQVDLFADSAAFLDTYKSEYDIIFLDIQMPQINGMTLAKKIRTLDAKVILVFITQMPQYAVEGYEVEALGYMLKPINYFDFCLTMNRVLQRLKKKRAEVLLLKSEMGWWKIPTDNIFYVEVLGHYLIFHTKEEQIKIRGTIEEIAGRLKKFGYALVHRSYLVNLQYVERLTNNAVIVGGESVPLAASKRKGLLQELSDYWGN